VVRQQQRAVVAFRRSVQWFREETRTSRASADRLQREQRRGVVGSRDGTGKAEPQIYDLGLSLPWVVF